MDSSYKLLQRANASFKAYSGLTRVAWRYHIDKISTVWTKEFHHNFIESALKGWLTIYHFANLLRSHDNMFYGLIRNHTNKLDGELVTFNNIFDKTRFLFGPYEFLLHENLRKYSKTIRNTPFIRISLLPWLHEPSLNLEIRVLVVWYVYILL